MLTKLYFHFENVEQGAITAIGKTVLFDRLTFRILNSYFKNTAITISRLKIG